jgi:hypothetical protein
VEWEGGEDQRRRPPAAEGDATVFFPEPGEERHDTASRLRCFDSSWHRYPVHPATNGEPTVRPSLSFAHLAHVCNGDTNVHGHSLDAPYRERFGWRPELAPHPRTCTCKHSQAAAFVEPQSRENANVTPKNGARSPWLELAMARSHSRLLAPVAI